MKNSTYIFYGPQLPISLSVGPLTEQTMTPYQYTYQNPVRYIDPTGMAAEDPPNLYLIEKYRGTVLEYHHSNSNSIEIIGKKSSYFAKPYLDKNDNLVGFGIATEEGRLDYVISKSDFNDFTKGVDQYRLAADFFNANGTPSESMIAYTSAAQEGDLKGMFNAVVEMWKEPGAARDALITTLVGAGSRSLAGNSMKNAAKGGSSFVDDVAKQAKSWLGKDYKVITNKAGDNIFISKDGLRKMRFDIKNLHGDKPHIHLEIFKNGKWRDAIPGNHRIYSKQ